GDDDVVRAPLDLQQPVVIDPSEVGRPEPPWWFRVAGWTVAVAAEVTAEHRRPADPDEPVGAHRDGDTVERPPVVDAAASGLGHPVRGDEPDAGRTSAIQQGLRGGRAAEQDGVELL